MVQSAPPLHSLGFMVRSSGSKVFRGNVKLRIFEMPRQECPHYIKAVGSPTEIRAPSVGQSRTFLSGGAFCIARGWIVSDTGRPCALVIKTETLARYNT